MSPSITAAVSPASKNISKGLWAEEKAKAFYIKQKYKFLKSRWQSPFAEVDLVLRDPSGILVLVEVKSHLREEFLAQRISRKQKQRLGRVLRFLSERGRLCRLELAVVSQSGDVRSFSDVFG